MCRAHWRKVDPGTRAAVHAAWRQVKDSDRFEEPWQVYKAIRQDAINEAAT